MYEMDRVLEIITMYENIYMNIKDAMQLICFSVNEISLDVKTCCKYFRSGKTSLFVTNNKVSNHLC